MACGTMTNAVGYDATYLSIRDGRNWAAHQQLNRVKEHYDLEVEGIYVALNLRLGAEAELNAGIYQMLKGAPPGSTVELAIKTAGDFARSDSVGDEPVMCWLGEALSIARQCNSIASTWAADSLQCQRDHLRPHGVCPGRPGGVRPFARLSLAARAEPQKTYHVLRLRADA